MAAVNVRHYPAEVLRRFLHDMVRAFGAGDDVAAICSEGVLTAALWWHPGQGQGLEKLFRWEKQVKNGGINPKARPAWVTEGPAVALMDADKAFGYAAGAWAMTRAVELARSAGVGFVAVRHSNHFGIAGYHARTAARAGMIGLAMTNAAAEMAPWGAKEPVLGTNPWGLAVPRGGHEPIVLDMALTMSGRGMIRWAHREGRPVPDDWALTLDGRRTTNPAELIAGMTQLPIGKYKGYGLSLFTDVLCGVMTGSLFGTSVFQDLANHDVGHAFLAVDFRRFIEEARFYERLEELVAEVKAAAPITPGDPIYLPGEPELARARQRLAEGVPVDVETVEGLRPIAAAWGVDFPL